MDNHELSLLSLAIRKSQAFILDMYGLSQDLMFQHVSEITEHYYEVCWIQHFGPETQTDYFTEVSVSPHTLDVSVEVYYDM